MHVTRMHKESEGDNKNGMYEMSRVHEMEMEMMNILPSLLFGDLFSPNNYVEQFGELFLRNPKPQPYYIS
jgi:hypothetical protein